MRMGIIYFLNTGRGNLKIEEGLINYGMTN